MKPLHFSANPLQPISQQLWADAVYVKDMWELGHSKDGCHVVSWGDAMFQVL